MGNGSILHPICLTDSEDLTSIIVNGATPHGSLRSTWVPDINSTGIESYPFVSESGILYFSSDGWAGLGKKDIFYTVQTEDGWISPVHLDAHINSKEMISESSPIKTVRRVTSPLTEKEMMISTIL